MRAVRPRALAGAIALAFGLLIAGFAWHVPARGDESSRLSGKYLRLSFAKSVLPGRDGILTDVTGTALEVDATGIYLESETYLYQNADSTKEVAQIFVPWSSVLLVTVLPPKGKGD